MFSAFKSAQQRTITAWFIATTNVGVHGIVAGRSGKARAHSGLKKISRNLRRRPLM
jgi:hypothetical protein